MLNGATLKITVKTKQFARARVYKYPHLDPEWIQQGRQNIDSGVSTLLIASCSIKFELSGLVAHALYLLTIVYSLFIIAFIPSALL